MRVIVDTDKQSRSQGRKVSTDCKYSSVFTVEENYLEGPAPVGSQELLRSFAMPPMILAVDDGAFAMR
jgi:hypothetical protein